MSLEPNFNYIDDLNPNNPATNDPVSEGDDHLRGIKNALQGNVLGDQASTQLLTDGTVTFQTESVGAYAKRTNASGLARLGLRLQDDTEAMSLQVDELVGHRLVCSIADLPYELRLNDAGTFRTLIAAGPADGVTLNFFGVARVKTTGNGVDFFGGQADLDNSGQDAGVTFLARNAIGGVTLGVDSGDGKAALNQRDSDGTFEKIWIRMLRDGRVDLYHDNVARIATTSVGARVWGSTAEVNPNGAAAARFLAINPAGGIDLNLATEGFGQIRQRSVADGAEGNWITFTRFAQVALFYNNAQKMQTGNGGVLVTGQADISATAPTEPSHATRKDYVDIRTNSVIQPNDGRIGLGEQGGGGTLQQSGIITAVGQNFTINFSAPFAATPWVVCTALNPADLQNGFAYIKTVSTSNCTGLVGAAGLQVMWFAYGARN